MLVPPRSILNHPVLFTDNLVLTGVIVGDDATGIDIKVLEILRGEESRDTPTTRLKIEVPDHEFEICQEKNVYYGYSKITIEPYFQQDKYNYKQFLQIQRHYEYYFKFEVQ